MSTARVFAKERLDQILETVIDERCRLVLTHNSPRGWRTFKASFASGSLGSQSVRLEVLTPSDTSESALPRLGDTLGVTFRVGHKKCMFAASVESIDWRADHGFVGLRWPDHLKQLQRRAFQRAKPPRNASIAVRVWREAEPFGAHSEARDVRHGELEDLSAGGMRVKVANADDFELESICRCVFTPRPGKPSVIVDAVVRHREAAEHGRASIGFQFVGLETTPEGRRVLAHPVTQAGRAVGRAVGHE